MRYDLRASAQRRDQITRARLDQLVPTLMAELDIDCWLISSREYSDDAIAMTMLPAEWLTSRRRCILVFLRTESTVERLSVSRYDLEGFFDTVWNPVGEPDQWAALADLLRERSPRSIAINMSHHSAHADGLTHGEYEMMGAALGPDLMSRIVPADPLGVNWLETRLPQERETMSIACREAHAILGRALSTEAVTPGKTTTSDLMWWLRSEVQQLGTPTWFQPNVSLQRRGDGSRDGFATKPGPRTIEEGDLIHIDFGIVWDGLCTDQQQHGYVLASGQSAVPEWVNSALKVGNRMQDILTSSFATGQTGNQVLAKSLEIAAEDGVRGVVYTHPIGLHGHGAGPTIGLWDVQTEVSGEGDRKLRPNTAWSIELMVKVDVPEWDGQTISVMLEEDAWFDGTTVEYLDGRQSEVWPIG